MTADYDGSEILPHLSSEFFLWLWYSTEHAEGELDTNSGTLRFWLEDKMAFKSPHSDTIRAVVLGDNVSGSPEARAAMAAGKALSELRLHLQIEERDYIVTLKSPYFDFAGVKFPGHATDGFDSLVFERMQLYEELFYCIAELYRAFADARTSETWTVDILPRLRDWIHGTLA